MRLAACVEGQTEEIGLGTIRAACPRFDSWLTRLESMATE